MTNETKIRHYYQSIGRCPRCHGKNKLLGDEKNCPECRAKLWAYKKNYEAEHPEYITSEYDSYLEESVCPFYMLQVVFRDNLNFLNDSQYLKHLGLYFGCLGIKELFEIVLICDNCSIFSHGKCNLKVPFSQIIYSLIALAATLFLSSTISA